MTDIAQTLIQLSENIKTTNPDSLRYLKQHIKHIGQLPEESRQIIVRNLVASAPDVSPETFRLIGKVLLCIVPSAEVNDMTGILKMVSVLQEKTGPERIDFFIEGVQQAMNSSLDDRKNSIERALYMFYLFCFARPNLDLLYGYKHICTLLERLKSRSQTWSFLSEKSNTIITLFHDKMEEVD